MAVNQVIHGSTEMLQIADAVARDKSIDKSVVLTAMEEAMQRPGQLGLLAESQSSVGSSQQMCPGLGQLKVPKPAQGVGGTQGASASERGPSRSNAAEQTSPPSLVRIRRIFIVDTGATLRGDDFS